MSEPGPKPRGPALAWAVSLALLATATVQLARTYADARFGGAHFEPGTADFLYSATIYDDVFVNGYPMGGFQWSAATFAVPELLLYVPIRAVAGSTGAALMPWQAACFSALVLAAWSALAACASPRAKPWVGPAVCCVTAAFLALQAAQFLRTESRHFLYPDLHTGAQTLAFLSLGLVLHYMRSGARWRLTALMFVALSGAFSDRLYAVYFAVPAFSALGLARLFAPATGLTWRRILASAAAVALGCLAGLRLLKELPSPGTGADALENYWQGVEAADVGTRAWHLLGTAWVQVERGNALVAEGLAWPVVTLMMTITRGGVFTAYSILATAATVAALLVSAIGASWLAPESPNWGNFDRYLAGPMAIALFGWALPLAALFGRGGIARVLAALGAVALVAWPLTLTLMTPREPTRDLLAPYPDHVRVIDEVCQRRGLTRGFAGFFEAGPATHFSRASVRVVALLHNGNDPHPFVPFVWLSNAGYLARRPGEDRPGFVLARPGGGPGELRPEAVRAVFGEPAESVPAGDYVVMVYDWPQDDDFRDYLAWNPEAAKARYRAAPRESVRFLGRGFQGDAGRPAGLARVSGDSPGTLASGPYLRPQVRGWHFAEFRVRSSGGDRSNGDVAVHLIANDNRSAPLLSGPVVVPPGFDGTIRLEFHVSAEGVAAGHLDFRTESRGPGLVLESVEFGPLPRGVKPRGETVCPIAAGVR